MASIQLPASEVIKLADTMIRQIDRDRRNALRKSLVNYLKRPCICREAHTVEEAKEHLRWRTAPFAGFMYGAQRSACVRLLYAAKKIRDARPVVEDPLVTLTDRDLDDLGVIGG